MRCVRPWQVSALLFVPALLSAQSAPLPLKHAPQPTAAAITAADLMTRLYIFADDSMMGRETGTAGHVKSTDYIARELKRLGLEPAGDNGGYVQDVPMIRRGFDVASTIAAGGTTLKGGADFLAGSRGAVLSIDGAGVIFGGTALDTTNLLDAAQVAGKVVLLRPAPRGAPGGFARFRNPAYRGYFASLRDAAAVATIVDEITPAQVNDAVHPRDGDIFMRPGEGAEGTITLTVSPRAAEAMLGTPLAQATKGQVGGPLKADIRFQDQTAPARNVIGIVRGSDPALRGEYVAMGAHNDHVGLLQGGPVDHDSLHLYNQARFAIAGMVARGQPMTDDQRAAIQAIRLNLDSIRAARPARPDSIRNGADDDGSGSVTLLELAEAFARAPAKPKRSLLFVWHTGEEKGLLGSRWFSDHPTVPRDAIVAQLNMDMVGRGDAQDIPVGGPAYLQLVGSRRLSTELGDLVEAVNAKEAMPFRFDYQFDANGHPENIYCRSDHYHYARWGIPVAFFTTGLHGDYHQVSDEPQYIDYAHMARVGQLVHDVAVAVANLDHRVIVDHEKPDPNGRCQQ